MKKILSLTAIVGLALMLTACSTSLVKVEHYLPNGTTKVYYADEFDIWESEDTDAIEITNVNGKTVEIQGSYTITQVKQFESSEELQQYAERNNVGEGE